MTQSLKSKNAHIRKPTAFELIRFFTTPAIISLAVSGIWYYLRPFLVNVDPIMKLDEEVLSSGTMNGLFIFFSIFAAFAVKEAWDQLNVLVHACRKNDKETFLACADDRIPWAIHILQILSSAIPMVTFFITPFASTLLGGFTVFSMSLFFVTTFLITIDLDDAFLGIFNIVGVDPKWIEELEEQRRSNGTN